MVDSTLSTIFSTFNPYFSLTSVAEPDSVNTSSTPTYATGG